MDVCPIKLEQEAKRNITYLFFENDYSKSVLRSQITDQ